MTATNPDANALLFYESIQFSPGMTWISPLKPETPGLGPAAQVPVAGAWRVRDQDRKFNGGANTGGELCCCGIDRALNSDHKTCL